VLYYFFSIALDPACSDPDGWNRGGTVTHCKPRENGSGGGIAKPYLSAENKGEISQTTRKVKKEEISRI